MSDSPAQIIDFEELIPADWLDMGGGVVATHPLGQLKRNASDPEHPSAAAILASALLANGDNIGMAVWVAAGEGIAVEVGTRVFRWCSTVGSIEERTAGPEIASAYEAALDRAWTDMKRVWGGRTLPATPKGEKDANPH